MRKVVSFEIRDLKLFKEKLLNWSEQFDWVTYLDSNKIADENIYPSLYHTLDGLVAIGEFKEELFVATDFDSLKEFTSAKKDWLFGHIAYDAKNQIEKLHSVNIDEIKFPEVFFYQPRYVFLLSKEKIEIQYLPSTDSEKDINDLFKDINNQKPLSKNLEKLKFQPRVGKEKYLENIDLLKDHIQNGDIYEINYCQEFYAEDKTIDPLSVYSSINSISPTPFSCFYKLGDKYLLSASPERFLKKTGNKIISQPIKGTMKRGQNSQEDELLIDRLRNDSKENAENIMIVDLVRNDLSRSAKKGSVKVNELCGIYTFPQVHQMISTIVATVNDDMHPVDIIKNGFPMGSMTGAPKIRAMKLIEKYENSKRGLYSGAVGYFNPVGDFDFNVVIRSILYNKEKKYVSFSVGSAITIKSDPEYEYQECLIKAKAMLEALNAKIEN